MKKIPFRISQSFMNDAFHTESDLLKDKIQPNFCPMYLKFKYVDGKQTPPSAAMQLGNYFEWHLLGATRNGEEPILPRIGIKDQRPTKSASFPAMVEYLISKGIEIPKSGTGKQKDLKPAKSSAVLILETYILSKGGMLPEMKYSKTDLIDIIEKMPEDLGEPAVTCEDLFAIIQALPPDLTEGEISTQQKKMDQVIQLARTILSHLGLETTEGEKQIRVTTEEKSGHFDWITRNIENLMEGRAIYDVKFTQTKEDDWRNGWANISEREDAKNQASHYAAMYFEKYGEWLPFYFLIFGEDGWIQIIKMVMTEVGYSVYKVSFDRAKEMLNHFVMTNWKPRPEFNRCLKCPFSEECPDRAVLPEVTEFFL